MKVSCATVFANVSAILRGVVCGVVRTTTHTYI